MTIGHEEDGEGRWGHVRCEGLDLEKGIEVRQLRVTKFLAKVDGNEDGKDGGDGELEKEFEERMIWHFLFTAWPDHDVPQTRRDQRALLQLIKMSRILIDEEREGLNRQGILAPRIVHCSAGVGRTGTFIALDFLLQEFEDGKWDKLVENGDGDGKEVDPIFETVKRLRDQRMSLVYKIGQYEWLYQVLREKWMAKKRIVEKGGTEMPLSGSEESPAKKGKIEQNGTLETSYVETDIFYD